MYATSSAWQAAGCRKCYGTFATSTAPLSVPIASTSAAREAGGTELLGRLRTGLRGELEPAARGRTRDGLVIGGRRVIREQALAELVVETQVGLDVLAVDPDRLVITARRAERHGVRVDRVRDRLECEQPGGEPLDRRAEPAQVLEQRVRRGRSVAIDIEAERAEAIGDQVEVIRFIAALARERELDVELRRGRDPQRCELRDVDLVRQCDLEQRLRIRGDLCGQRQAAGTRDAGNAFGPVCVQRGEEVHAGNLQDRRVSARARRCCWLLC